MAKIKVAHLATVPITIQVFLLNQLRSLVKAGYEVTSISAPGTEVASIEAANIRHIPVPMTREMKPLADLISLWHLYRVLRRERFTIVHTHTPKACLYGQLAARLARVPIVVSTVHGFYFHENMSRLRRFFHIAIEKIAARCSDTIFFVSTEDAATSRREKIGNKSKLVELHGIGIDTRRFKRTALNENAIKQTRREIGLPVGVPVVGFVGRLVKEKGVLELLRAAQIILQQIPETRFLIIGPVDESKSDALTPRIAKRYGISERCIFTGKRRDMPVLYSLMHAFVLPSYREGFPVSVMEASAVGVPCIVTNVRGCREAIEHEYNGLVVPLGDVRALADAILDLLTNRDKALKIAEIGEWVALRNFDERRVFKTVETEYARLIAWSSTCGVLPVLPTVLNTSPSADCCHPS
jgi:glycosyltransferase involved in cell wall biosynthesis